MCFEDPFACFGLEVEDGFGFEVEAKEAGFAGFEVLADLGGFETDWAGLSMTAAALGACFSIALGLPGPVLGFSVLGSFDSAQKSSSSSTSSSALNTRFPFAVLTRTFRIFS